MSETGIEIETTVDTESTKEPWSYVALGVTFTKKRIMIGVVVSIIILLVILKYSGYLGEGFAGPFSLWGTPDWEIRDKGHKHQERSDSHVSKPKKGKWSITAFKKSVRDLNKKANV
jgi:hypothetical protein